MVDAMSGSLPQKLQLRQIFGGERLPRSSKPIKYYEKCPENLQIPLRRISNYDSFKNGHVYVGFSSDGKYLLSYQCKLSFQMDTEPVCYNYTLHWWLFDLWQPIRKVRQVQLFAQESIHYELHILICQPPYADYIVVHGSTYSVDTQSNGKMTYVSIIPADISNQSIHLRYELLPPHPPFVTSISLKLPNVILLNSGDMLFAVLLNKYTNKDDIDLVKNDTKHLSDCCCYCELEKRKLEVDGSIPTEEVSGKCSCESRLNMLEKDVRSDSTSSDESNTGSNSLGDCQGDCNKGIFDDNLVDLVTLNSIDSKVNKSHRNSSEFISRSPPIAYKNNMQCITDEKSCFSLKDEVTEFTEKVAESSSSPNKSCNSIFATPIDSPIKDGRSTSNDVNVCNKEYVSYVMQGFSLPTDNISQESLPASPYDCTTQVLPCHLSSFDGNEVLKHTYEHRCFRNADKGNKSGCDYFIGQSQFDAENFVNEEIQLCDDMSRRYVSMRDYDMQIIDVCEETNEVIILINALVVFRDIVQRDENMNSQLNKHGVQREPSYKLVLYTLGYIVSWNVYTGRVTVLKRYPIVEGPGTICKSRQFAPSLSQTVQLRKGFFVPSAKGASVQTLSNHTVFSGKSLQYLFNPLLPVAVVM